MNVIDYVPHVIRAGKIVACSAVVIIVILLVGKSPTVKDAPTEGDLQSGPPDWGVGADLQDYGYLPLPNGKVLEISHESGSGVSWNELRRERYGDKIDVIADITLVANGGAVTKVDATVIAHYRYVPMERRNPKHWWQVVGVTVFKFKRYDDE